MLTVAVLRQSIARQMEEYKKLDSCLAELDQGLSIMQLPALPEGVSLPVAPSEPEEVEKMTPTEAVRFLFDQQPKWIPKELATELKKIHREGRLQIKEGNDPVHSLHNILSSLVKQDFLAKHQPQPKSQRSWYVKKEADSEQGGSGSAE